MGYFYSQPASVITSNAAAWFFPYFDTLVFKSCLNEALKIERQVNGRSLNEIKINEIKTIVRSIFESSKDVK